MVLDCPCGFTFRLRGHLYVVVAELSRSPEQVIVVSLTTRRAGSDETVVFTAGDHPFIKHDTAINYQDTRRFDKADLLDRINRRFFEPGQSFSDDKITVIQQGLLRSPHTPNDIKSDCAAAFSD
jgi:hypothetical protein